MWHQHQRRSNQRQYYPLILGMMMMWWYCWYRGWWRGWWYWSTTLWLSILSRLHWPSHVTHESKYFSFVCPWWHHTVTDRIAYSFIVASSTNDNWGTSQPWHRWIWILCLPMLASNMNNVNLLPIYNPHWVVGGTKNNNNDPVSGVSFNQKRTSLEHAGAGDNHCNNGDTTGVITASYQQHERIW